MGPLQELGKDFLWVCLRVCFIVCLCVRFGHLLKTMFLFKSCYSLHVGIFYDDVLCKLVFNVTLHILISAPSLGVCYFLSLTLSVCLCVSLLLQSILLFLFLDGIEPFFGRHFSMWHSTKRCSSIFDLVPLTPKIYSPKFALVQNRL